MSALVVDTHTLVWYVDGSPLLSASALALLQHPQEAEYRILGLPLLSACFVAGHPCPERTDLCFDAEPPYPEYRERGENSHRTIEVIP